jgi:hypothetical protein
MAALLTMSSKSSWEAILVGVPQLRVLLLYPTATLYHGSYQ